MEDRKNAEKIKIMAMLKGEIKSEVIEDVQKEFDKSGGYTIERIFAFDRNTVWDKYKLETDFMLV